jgi:hypothetical protein
MGKDLSEDSLKLLIKLLIFNSYFKERNVPGGFGTTIEPTPDLLNWFNIVEKDIRNNKIMTLDYDNIKYLVENDENLLNLNITNSFNKLNNIKLVTKIDILIDEFELDNN